MGPHGAFEASHAQSTVRTVDPVDFQNVEELI